MLLKYTTNDDDFKFLFYYYNRNIKFQKDSHLSFDNIFEFDLVVEKLFELANEEFTAKKLAEFKKIRKSPIISKNVTEITLLSLLNYINVIKQTLISGTLKNKEYIDNFTVILKESLDFDPEFYFLDIKAGFIESIEDAEGMDKLYCEKVKAIKDYFICSGLRGRYPKEDMINKTFLFLLNIKKVKFRTLESEGMICCTGNEKVEPLKVNAPQGSKLQLDSFPSLFDDLEYGKVDLSKNSYKSIFERFKIIDHHLTFKGLKVICNGEYVITSAKDGDVK